MKCLVLDDEPMALETLRDYIGKVPFLECSATFRDPMQALDYLQKNEVDLLFLDIHMPNLSGIQLLKALTHPPLLIFTTAYSEYAVESYNYDAVDYLLKPIEFDRFLKAVHKAAKKLQLQSKRISHMGKTLFIKSGTKHYKIKTNDVLYIKGTGNYVTFVTKEREILSLSTMRDVSGLLASPMFIRVHKSYIINFHYVDVIESDRIKIGDQFIPVGEFYREEFLNAIRQIKSQSPE